MLVASVAILDERKDNKMGLDNYHGVERVKRTTVTISRRPAESNVAGQKFAFRNLHDL